MVETVLTILFAIGFVGGFYFLAHYFGVNSTSPDGPEPLHLRSGNPRRDELS